MSKLPIKNPLFFRSYIPLKIWYFLKFISKLKSAHARTFEFHIWIPIEKLFDECFLVRVISQSGVISL